MKTFNTFHIQQPMKINLMQNPCFSSSTDLQPYENSKDLTASRKMLELYK
jgi:hypothetical protein